MEIPVLVEPLTDRKGYRATVGSPFSLTVDGETRDEAVGNLHRLTRDRLGSEGELRTMEVVSGNPWTDLAGFLPDDDLTHEWMEIMKDRRRLANESPDGLLPEV